MATTEVMDTDTTTDTITIDQCADEVAQQILWQRNYQEAYTYGYGVTGWGESQWWGESSHASMIKYFFHLSFSALLQNTLPP